MQKEKECREHFLLESTEGHLDNLQLPTCLYYISWVLNKKTETPKVIPQKKRINFQKTFLIHTQLLNCQQRPPDQPFTRTSRSSSIRQWRVVWQLSRSVGLACSVTRDRMKMRTEPDLLLTHLMNPICIYCVVSGGKGVEHQQRRLLDFLMSTHPLDILYHPGEAHQKNLMSTQMSSLNRRYLIYTIQHLPVT